MGKANVLKQLSLMSGDTIAAQVAHELISENVTGKNLMSWRLEHEISYDQIWERLGVSALEYRSWETAAVSPDCSRFFEITEKMGQDTYFKSVMMVSHLIMEGQLLRRQFARWNRWDHGYKPATDALGAVKRHAA